MLSLPMQTGLCRNCNYALRDLPEARCPECGTAFNPADPKTMNMGRPIGPFAKWILGPTGCPWTLTTILPLVWMLWIFREPGPYYMGIFFIPAVLVALLIASRFVWTFIRMTTAHIYRQPYLPSQGNRRQMILSACVVVTILLVLLKVPLRIGFALSRPAMESFVSELVNEPFKARPPSQRVGIYRMSTTLRRNGSGTIQLHMDGSFEEGFGYSLEQIEYAGTNAGSGGHLTGPWYWFSDD